MASKNSAKALSTLLKLFAKWSTEYRLCDICSRVYIRKRLPKLFMLLGPQNKSVHTL